MSLAHTTSEKLLALQLIRTVSDNPELLQKLFEVVGMPTDIRPSVGIHLIMVEFTGRQEKAIGAIDRVVSSSDSVKETPVYTALFLGAWSIHLEEFGLENCIYRPNFYRPDNESTVRARHILPVLSVGLALVKESTEATSSLADFLVDLEAACRQYPRAVLRLGSISVKQ